MGMGRTIELWSYFLPLCMAALCAAPAVATDEQIVYESKSLSDPFKVEFELKEGERVLLEATQYLADVRISVRDLERDTEVTSVNFPFEKRLPEVLVVGNQDCKRCEVILSGVTKADSASPSVLKLRELDLDEQQIVRQIRVAGERHQSLIDENKQSDIELIVEDLETAAEIAGSRGLMNWRWHALTLISEQMVSLGEFDQQKRVLETIISETQGRDSIYRIQALYEIGSLEENLVVEKAGYVEGMRISKRLNKPLLWAMGANYLAILQVNEGRVSSAIKLLNQAYSMTTKYRSWRSLWNPLHNLSWANLRQGNSLAALKFSTELQLLAERFEDYENELWALYDIARCHRENGSQGLAEQTFDTLEEKLELYSELDGSSVGVLKAALFQEKSELLLNYGKLSEAVDYVQSMREQEQSLGFKKRLPAVTYLEGKIALANGDKLIGLDKVKQAREYDLTNGWMRSYASKGLFLSNWYAEDNDYLEASSFLISSLKELSGTTDYKTIAASVTSAIGVLNGLEGYKEANQIAQISEGLVDQYADELTRLEYSINIAKTAFYLNDWNRADELLARARGLAHQNLNYIIRKDLRKRFLGLNKQIYELSIANSLVNVQGNKDALELAEEYKAILVSDAIYSVSPVARDQNQYKTRLGAILNRLNNASQEWFRTNDEEFLKRARKLSADLYKFESEMREKNQERLSKQLEVAQRVVPKKGQLRISYFLGEQRSWAWVEDSDRIESYELPARVELEDLINQIVANTRVSPVLRKSRSAWADSQTIKQVSQLLLSPLEKFTSEIGSHQSGYTLLTVVPDGALQNFPFAALQYGIENKNLLDSFAIQVLPSIHLGPSAESQSVNIVSNSEHALLVANSNPFVLDNINLPRIQGVETEVKSIQKSFGSRIDVYRTFGSTEEATLVIKKSHYSIIHFATHALLNRRNPLLSGLVLPFENNTNRFFIAPEIVANQFAAKLIVLSGCNTSSSVLGDEGGLNSLSLAFIDAGAQSVIGSQWEVDDFATAVLMGYFYENLIERKKSPSQALAKAQSMLRKNHVNWQDPYYWAGFQITTVI